MHPHQHVSWQSAVLCRKGLFSSEAGPVVAVHKDVQEDVAAAQLSQFTIQLTQLTSRCSLLLLQIENPGFDSLDRRRMTRAVNDSNKENKTQKISKDEQKTDQIIKSNH